MHDIERGGNTTATRLAALAALRDARADDGRDGAQGDGEDSAEHYARIAREHASTPRSLRGSGPEHGPASRFGQDVFAAVEVAVKRSRLEFIARLADYRRKLDCEAIRDADLERLAASLDEAQFVAHRIAGVGETLGFPDLGASARQTEAAITAYKLERSADLRQTAISRICTLSGLIDLTCAELGDCPA